MRILLFTLALLALPYSAQANRLSVIELFTSQGCSSCPPADQLIGELGEREDILALSYHVDYWDYIGWKDPYASPKNNAYQQDYAAKFGLRYVYTPQAVINGKREFIGSQRESIVSMINREKRLNLKIDFRYEDNRLYVSGLAPRLPYTVQRVDYVQKTETPIARGENSGRTLHNYNSVLHVEDLGVWQGGVAHFSIPPVEFGHGQAILVRDPNSRDILAAYKIQ